MPLPEAKPEELNLVMPSLDNGPAEFFDTASGSFWVGVPVGKVDPVLAAFIFDKCKLAYHTRFLEFHKAAEKKSAILKPNGWQNIKNKVSKLLQH